MEKVIKVYVQLVTTIPGIIKEFQKNVEVTLFDWKQIETRLQVLNIKAGDTVILTYAAQKLAINSSVIAFDVTKV